MVHFKMIKVVNLCYPYICIYLKLASSIFLFFFSFFFLPHLMASMGSHRVGHTDVT